MGRFGPGLYRHRSGISTLDPIYEGLPVVIVNDWSEITTEENMDKWINLFIS